MRRTTRRELAAGSLVLAGTWPVAARAAAGDGSRAERCEPRRPAVRRTAVAVTPDGRTAWTADATTSSLTAHTARDAMPGVQIALPGVPLALALLAGARRAVVVLEGGAIAVVDLRARAVVARHETGRDARAIAVDPAGRAAAVVGGGADGWLRRLDPRSGAPRAGAPTALPAHPRGVAMGGAGTAVVACNAAAALAVVDLATGDVRTIATAPFPAQVVVAPDGRRAYVSHDGYRARHVTPVDLVALRAGRPWRTGADPGGLAVLQRGRALAVAERGTGRLVLLDATTGRRRRRVTVGGTPRAVAAGGRRAVVVDDETGRLTAVAA